MVCFSTAAPAADSGAVFSCGFDDPKNPGCGVFKSYIIDPHINFPWLWGAGPTHTRDTGPSHDATFGGSKWPLTHYRDVIMIAMASQIASVWVVCSTICSGADQRKHQSSASLAVYYILSCMVNTNKHYNDVILSVMASQITSPTIDY